jgi:hypothetical protein
LSCEAGHEKARLSGVALVEACTAAGATRSWVSTSRTASATALPPPALEPISTRPANAADRLFARILRTGDRWFQIERLYRFNAKFLPAWQPRYLVYETITSLPRMALAVLWVEGQAPKPRVPDHTSRYAGRRSLTCPAVQPRAASVDDGHADRRGLLPCRSGYPRMSAR